MITLLKHLLPTVLLAAFCSVTSAQDHPLPTLTKGDTLPDLVLKNLLQYDRDSIYISEFKGRFLILDFWSTRCKSCVAAFPKLEHLQEQFKEKLTILPVAFTQTKDQVSNFIRQRRLAGHPINMPTAVYPDLNNELSQSFPSQGYPNIIWISPNETVDAITGSQEMTQENIGQWILKGKIDIQSAAKRQTFDRDQLLLVHGNAGADSNFVYRSMLTPYIDGISSYLLEKQKTENHIRLFIANASVLELLKECMNWRFDVHNKRVKFEAGQVPITLTGADPNTNLPKQNLYCYELVLPPAFDESQALNFMQQDVCRYFGLTARVEKRKTLCWALQWDHKTSLKSKTTKPSYKVSDDRTSITITNRPVSALVSALGSPDRPIIVNRTGITYNIDIAFSCESGTALTALNNSLLPFGLKLARREEYLETLVIRSAGN